MQVTGNLNLPLMAAQQTNKHFTHNEALLRIDAVSQLAIVSFAYVTPPTNCVEGDCYYIAGEGEGAWLEKQGHIAIYSVAGWRFTQPKQGWRAYDCSTAQNIVFDGVNWRDEASFLARIGVGTENTSENMLLVEGDVNLFTAKPMQYGGSGDVRIALNREAENNTASFLFQTDYVGAAEFGLLGSSGWGLKTSADGNSFKPAITVGLDDGAVALHALTSLKPVTVTIVADTISPIASHIKLKLNSGAIAQLKTIYAAAEGSIIMLRGEDGKTITLKHAAGNLRLGSDRVLSSAHDIATLVSTGSQWLLQSHSANQ